MFLAISTSGNSKNLVSALARARRQGVTTVALTGQGGGRMAEFSHYCIMIPSTVTMNIQEALFALEHIFRMLVERFIFRMDFDKQPQFLSE